MDDSITDEMLLEPFDMGEFTSIDIERYHKGLFSPSPKSMMHVTPSPEKVESPPRLVPQMIPQQHMQRPTQRKLQLGPDFDRLGILHEAIDIPVIAGPYFAKALQQHGGTTLGALLQAHQLAVQQAYASHYQARDDVFLVPQSNPPTGYGSTQAMNAYEHYVHEQMMHPATRSFCSDQIVPQAPYHVSASPLPQNVVVKQEPAVDRSQFDAPTPRSRLSACSAENESDVASDDEDELMFQDFLPGGPPKNTVLVCYPSDSRSHLPSFSEAFTGNINRLKMKEEHLREILVQHEEEQERQSILARERRCNPGGHVAVTMGQQDRPRPGMSMEVDSLINKDFEKVGGVEKSEGSKKTEASHVIERAMKQTDDAMGGVSTDDSIDYPELEFLHEPPKSNDILSCFDGNDSGTGTHDNPSSQPTLSQLTRRSSEESSCVRPLENKNLPLFEDDLVFSSHASYDNLFNGHTDEHYFNAFKQNNVHLVPGSSDNHPDSGSEAEMLTYLNLSPLHFLNESY